MASIHVRLDASPCSSLGLLDKDDFDDGTKATSPKIPFLSPHRSKRGKKKCLEFHSQSSKDCKPSAAPDAMLFCCSNVTGGEQGSGPLSKAFSSSCILYISLQRLLIGPRRRWRASKPEKAFFRHLEVAHRPLVSAIYCRLRKSRSTCRHRRRRGANLVLRGTCPCLLSHLWTMRSAIILPNFRRGRPRRCRSPPLLRNRR